MRERLAIALDMLPLDSLELISVVNQAASVVAALPEEVTNHTCDMSILTNHTCDMSILTNHTISFSSLKLVFVS